MLETLRQFDWDSVEHAYGPASDVPEQIEALNSGDPEAVKNAQWALFGNIFHQGTVYQATQHAVPFLIELLGPESKADKGWVMYYLTHLATGTSYHDVHKQFYSEEEVAKDDFQEKIAKELSDVEAANLAVREGVPVYLELLDSDDAEARSSAGFLLSLFRDCADLFVGKLKEHAVSDPDVVVRASHWISWSFVTTNEGVLEYVELAKKALETEAPYVKWAIANRVALVDIDEELAELCLGVMVAALNDESMEELHQNSPWPDGSIGSQTAQTLGSPDLKGRAATFIPQVQKAMENSLGGPALQIADALLDIAFKGEPIKEGRPFDDLDEDQKRVLTHLSYCKPAWVFNGNLSSSLQWYGLPSSDTQLQEFCGLEPKSMSNDISVKGAGGGGSVVATATIEPSED